MRKYLLLLACVLTLAVYGQEKPIPTAELMVQDLIETGDLNQDPLVILNGNSLEDLNVLKEIPQASITTIDVVSKRNPEMVDLYGSQAKNGLVFINTQEAENQYEDIIFLIDEELATKADVTALDPLEIGSVKVFVLNENSADYPEVVKKYLSSDVSGVVMVYLKQE